MFSQLMAQVQVTDSDDGPEHDSDDEVAECAPASDVVLSTEGEPECEHEPENQVNDE